MIVKIISKYTHVDSRVSRELIVKEGRYETEKICVYVLCKCVRISVGINKII